nr:hypothetical protein [Tanacetum cinerariifolium]
MSNTNNTMETQTSKALHNVIMEAGGKDRPPILALGMDNDIYSIVDACPNALEMWKAIERLKKGESINVQDLEINLYWEFGKFTSRDGESLKSYYSRSKQATTRNRSKAIVNSTSPTYNLKPNMVAEDNEMSKEKEIDKLMDLISLSFNKIYKPTNNNLRTSSNTNRANQDTSPRINRGSGYDNQRAVNVDGARETVAYHKEKMILCKQEEAGFLLNAEQADWKDGTNDEHEDQELESHYLYMVKIQEVILDAIDNSGPIFDTKPLQKVQHDNNNYNVFANERIYYGQPESVNNTYMVEHSDSNVIIDSLDASLIGKDVDHDDDPAREHDLLASLIDIIKCEINDNKSHNKLLESSNKTLVDKLKGEIEDFKNKNKNLKSSNNQFKEENNELAKTNQLMFKDIKKFQAKLIRYHDVNYVSKVETECIKAKRELISHKISFESLFNEYTRKINDLNQIRFEKRAYCTSRVNLHNVTRNRGSREVPQKS